MYDQVTLGLNVDPFILSALKEDITSEDVSTNSVMPAPTTGVVDLICKEDGIICGLQIFERVFTLLDPSTKAEFYVKDGDHVENKELWQELLSLTKIHDVTFHKVKGHADNEYNNRCDELARNAIKNL